MVGTDGTGGGPTYAHELNNHVRAGISTWDVLRMATSGNAALMGLTTTGRLAVGLEADLVFLRADPTADVKHTREVALVVTNGVAHEPDDVLDVARQIAAAARTRGAE
jgi:imidazolonepropionase-like amidohydrolase